MDRSGYIPKEGEVETMANTAFGGDVRNEIFFCRRDYGSWVGVTVSIALSLNPSL